jgi:hypothetical protein
MKRPAVSRFSVVRRAAGARRAATRTDPDARVGARPPVLLELQWQGSGGKFRHLVLTPRGLRRVLGTSGIVVLLALAAVGVRLVRSDRALGHVAVGTVVRENAELKARHDALRERAFDLAAQLDERIELERRMLGMAETPAHTWKDQSLRLPARDAEDEAILAWLSQQEARFEALGNELAARRVETGGQQAAVPAPANRAVPARGAAMFQVAGLGSAGPQEAAPTRR